MTDQHDKAKRWRLNPRPVVGLKIMQFGACMILVGVVHVLGWWPEWIMDRGMAQSAVIFGLACVIIVVGFFVRRTRTE